MTTIKEKRCYTVKEIQEILNISKPSVYNLLKKGEFHSVFVAGRHLISKASFDSWLNGYEDEPKIGIHTEDKMDEDIRLDKSSSLVTRGDSLISYNFNAADNSIDKEEQKRQEQEEMIIRNLLKAYLMINSTGLKN